jgi:hypothetical protein
VSAAAREAYASGAGRAEALIGGTVAPGDVVVLHDALTVALARAVRERGAHAIWHVRSARGAQAPGARAARACRARRRTSQRRHRRSTAGGGGRPRSEPRRARRPARGCVCRSSDTRSCLPPRLCR